MDTGQFILGGFGVIRITNLTSDVVFWIYLIFVCTISKVVSFFSFSFSFFFFSLSSVLFCLLFLYFSSSFSLFSWYILASGCLYLPHLPHLFFSLYLINCIHLKLTFNTFWLAVSTNTMAQIQYSLYLPVILWEFFLVLKLKFHIEIRIQEPGGY